MCVTFFFYHGQQQLYTSCMVIHRLRGATRALSLHARVLLRQFFIILLNARYRQLATADSIDNTYDLYRNFMMKFVPFFRLRSL